MALTARWVVAVDDVLVFRLCCVVLTVASALVLVARRKRRRQGGERPVVSVSFVELLRNYGPGCTLDLHLKYGAMTFPRCWTYWIPLDPRIIATVNASVVRHVLVDKFPNYEKGPQWRTAFMDLLGTGIFNADGHAWRKQRKVSSHEFSVNSMRGFMHGIFVDHAEKILAGVAGGGGAGGGAPPPVDAQELFAQYTLQSIGQIGFGVDLGALRGPEGAAVAADFGDAFNAATQLSGDRFVDPLWRLKRFLGVGSERRLADAIARVRAFSLGVVADRRAEKDADLKAKRDLLSRFMAHQDTSKEFVFTDEELHFAVINFVLAGRDTTANQLTWLLYECCRRPEVVAAIRAESDALGNRVDYEAITKRVYLKAALTETLRLYPSVPTDFKTALKDDVLPDGTGIRRGERVMFATWAMGRMEEYWDDPLAFDPGRFLDGGKFLFPDACKMPAFLAGPRTCLGKDVAYLGTAVLVASLLDAFDVAYAGDADPVYDTGLTMWAAGPVPIAFTPRR